MRLRWWLTAIPVCLAAQTVPSADTSRLLRDLRTAIQDDSPITAAELASKLDEAVQQRYITWLMRDTDERIDEALTWLPADTESFWANRQPFVVSPEHSVDLQWRRPNESYSLDRLAAINDGQFYRVLGNRRIRLVVAGARNIRANGMGGVPGPAPEEDVAYIFFLTEPVNFAAPTEFIQGRPVWRAIGKIDSREVPRPGEKQAQRDDENWLALARPDVMILTNKHALLAETLERVILGSKTRAMPPDLPEWTHVDRGASFWGLRHYSDISKAKRSGANLPHYPDEKAVGATVRFDSTTQQLEIVYLSPAELTRRGRADPLAREFQVDQPQFGVWRMVSDIRAKGAFPMNFAFAMLGFGIYR